MKLRVLINTSSIWGVIDSNNFDKDAFVKYINSVIRMDFENEQKENLVESDKFYNSVLDQNKMSLIPVATSYEAWDYLVNIFNKSKNPADDLLRNMLGIFKKYQKPVFETSLDNRIETELLIFMFPPLHYWLSEEEIANVLYEFGEELTGILDKHDDENDIDDISFALITEEHEDEEIPENILYN